MTSKEERKVLAIQKKKKRKNKKKINILRILIMRQACIFQVLSLNDHSKWFLLLHKVYLYRHSLIYILTGYVSRSSGYMFLMLKTYEWDEKTATSDYEWYRTNCIRKIIMHIKNLSPINLSPKYSEDEDLRKIPLY
uniref:Uncharacterized protein n=1 Tax=Onchocerca volvulus TaxID=6282 RepID=A0A8R1U0C4_ONCVO